MRRSILFILVFGLFAAHANAALWELDKPTALGFTTYTDFDGGGGDTIGSLGVYDKSIGYVSGTNFGAYGVPFTNEVGFVGGPIVDLDGGGDDLVTAEISYGGDPGLTGSGYDGIAAYIANDNDDIWAYQLFYIIGATEYSSGAFVEVGPAGGHAYLSTGAPGGEGGLDLADIDDIGFRVQGDIKGGAYPSGGDTFHASVVPVPAAVWLGMLGLSAAGLRLRKKRA